MRFMKAGRSSSMKWMSSGFCDLEDVDILTGML